MYSVDASAIIDAWWLWYSPSHHPSLWNKLEYLASVGKFEVPGLVLEEIDEKDDEVSDWCKDRESILRVDSGKEVQSNVRELVARYPNLTQGDGDKNSADPFVIALAMHRRSTVVTHEEPTGDLTGPRIPDVCNDVGLEWTKLPGVFERENWEF